MTETFDPHEQWLGISTDGSSPNYYELLGLPLFEEDKQRIRDAYQQHHQQVQPYEVGTYEEQALALLDELSEAYQCLTSATAKPDYDRELRARIQGRNTTSDHDNATQITPHSSDEMAVIGDAAVHEDLDEALASPAVFNTPSQMIAGVLRPLDGWLRVRLRRATAISSRSLWIVAVLCVFAAVVVAGGVLVDSRVRTSRELATLRKQVDVSRCDAEHAKRVVDDHLESTIRSASYQAGTELLFEADQAATDDNLIMAVGLYARATNCFRQAELECPAANELGRTQEAWAAAWVTEVSSALRERTPAAFHAIHEKAVGAANQAATGNLEEAQAAYREAFDLLREAENLTADREEWSASLAEANRDGLQDNASTHFDTALEKAASAGAAAESGDLSNAGVLYREALSALNDAIVESDKRKRELVLLDDALEAWVSAIEGAETGDLEEYAADEFAAAKSKAATADRLATVGKAKEAAALYGEALAALDRAKFQADDSMEQANSLAEAQQAWSSALEAVDTALLEEHVIDELTTAQNKAEEADFEAKAGNSVLATTLYREASTLLDEANRKATFMVRNSELAVETLVRQLEAAVDAKDAFAVYDLLPLAEEKIPGDSRVRRLRSKIKSIPVPAKAPFSAEAARQLQLRWATCLKLPVEQTNVVGMKFVLIPPGEFAMGSPIREPDRDVGELQHRVRITKLFYVSVCEVRQLTYSKVMGVNWGGYANPLYPVSRVTWDDAVAFCERLNGIPQEKLAGRVYRLPTEAEWEYACRAGTTGPYHFNANPSQAVANLRVGGSSSSPKSVGSYWPNAFGLFDMHGNASEWCADFYDSNYYRRSPAEDPQGPATGVYRVFRGGSWYQEASACRAAQRFSSGLGSSFYTGIRVVCSFRDR